MKTVSALVLSLFLAILINSVHSYSDHGLCAAAGDGVDTRDRVMLAQATAPGSAEDYATTFRRLSESYGRDTEAAKKVLEILYENDDAAKWLRSAEEQCNSYGQFHVGRMYDYGLGVAKDPAEAVKWFRKVAEQGDEQRLAIEGKKLRLEEQRVTIERDRLAMEKSFWKKQAVPLLGLVGIIIAGAFTTGQLIVASYQKRNEMEIEHRRALLGHKLGLINNFVLAYHQSGNALQAWHIFRLRRLMEECKPPEERNSQKIENLTQKEDSAGTHTTN